MTTESVLFALLRKEICGETVSQEIRDSLSPEMLEAVFSLARKHNLSHLVGQSLSKLGALGQDDVSAKFQRGAMNAVSLHIQMSHAFYCICQALEAARIPFLPLKGSVLRDWYPEPWMRVCSDIDILVRPEDYEAATNYLIDKCGCRYVTESGHDVSLFFPGDIHIEIHHTLIENTVSAAQEKVLGEVWDTAYVEAGYEYLYRMSDIMFRFYHYAHMAKHIKHGGCGIRPFLDLWVMDQRAGLDRTGEEALLVRGELLNMANAAEKLAQVWFSGAKPDAISLSLAQYIMDGGAQGSLKNRLSITQNKKGGKLQYAFYRIFMPYNNLKEYYPVLNRKRWLTPVYQVVRWFRLIFKGGMRRSIEELRMNADMTREESDSIAELLTELGM